MRLPLLFSGFSAPFSKRNRKTDKSVLLRLKRSMDINEAQKDFNTLYDSLSSEIWGYLKRDFTPPPPSEDGLKDAFSEGWAKLYRYRNKYDEKKGQVITWAYTIFKNCAKTERDREVKRMYKNTMNETESKDLLVVDAPDQSIIFNDLIRNVHNAIDISLKDIEKEVVVKYFFNEMTYQQIADEMGRSVGGIYKIMNRSIRALKPIISLEIN